MADTPPTLPVPTHQKDRYSSLQNFFKGKYGEDSMLFARSSGRVNIIGEHIDYCGYGVLPMAIEQDVVAAFSLREDGVIHLSNIDDKYEDFSCKLENIEINKENPKWFHYFLCGVRGIADFNGIQPKDLVGMNVAVDGRVPPSAGLSSSSALVCAAALVAAGAIKKIPSKTELSELCAKCEHYIGTEGGGMDQSIAFLAQAGTAKFIEFNPLRTKDVSLPDGGTFVVANSCAEINKAASSHFNSRVAEVRLASQVIAKKHNLDWHSVKTLGKLQESLQLSLEGMLQLVSDDLHEEPYSKDEVCEILGVSCEELDKISLSERTWALKEFKLRDRALHVYAEANRVHQFQRVCSENPDDILEQLGDLMNTSHASCRDLYQCSAEALDTLCKLACESGAVGSRLTGAGWGGCCVSLVPNNKVQSFIKCIEEGYYQKDATLQEKRATALFASRPGPGAAFYSI